MTTVNGKVNTIQFDIGTRTYLNIWINNELYRVPFNADLSINGQTTNIDELIKLIAGIKTELNVELSIDDKAYVPVRAANFVSWGF